jgi:hypothetical protein
LFASPGNVVDTTHAGVEFVQTGLDVDPSPAETSFGYASTAAA